MGVSTPPGTNFVGPQVARLTWDLAPPFHVSGINLCMLIIIIRGVGGSSNLTINYDKYDHDLESNTQI